MNRQAYFTKLSPCFLAAALWLVLTPSASEAKNCGGTVPCACGDTVTANYTLTADLGPCPGNGLTITGTTQRTVDLQSFSIIGDGVGDDCGICITGNNHIVRTTLSRASGQVTGFGQNVRIRGNANLVEKLLLDDGNQYGLALDGDNNTIKLNDIRSNGDEGLHCSPGSTGNTIRQNLMADNAAEQLYLLGCDNNTVVLNTFRGGTTGAYVKHSDGNRFGGPSLKNIHESSASQVVGDSVGNTFGDTFRRLMRVQPNGGFTPHTTTFDGSTFTNSAGTCFRNDQATGTVLRNGSMTNCGTDIVCNGVVGGPLLILDVENFTYETADVQLANCRIQ
jgi:hypothetical protein